MLYSLSSLDKSDLANKVVLVRVDFNVPLDSKGSVTDDTRIKASIPTIQYLIERDAKVVLLSHLGRPKDKKISLEVLIPTIEKNLGQPVSFVNDCVGDDVALAVKKMKNSSVLLLENVRFYDAEENPKKDPQFAIDLATNKDLFIFEAFATAHRKHSSTYNICSQFPDRCYAGLLMEKEVSFLQAFFSSPTKPVHALIGGAKISTKLGILHSLLDTVDVIYIGGAMAFPFYVNLGFSIGNCKVDPSHISQAASFLQKAKKKRVSVELPIDVGCASHMSEDAEITYVSLKEGVPPNLEIFDIGPLTVEHWIKELSDAQTVLWNGPVGAFEYAPFAEGTFQLAEILAGMPCMTIVGGGDSVAAINRLNIASAFSHVSTGGGATLEFIEQRTLPMLKFLIS